MSWSECCWCAMALYAACQRHMMVQYCCGSGSINKLFPKCFLLHSKQSYRSDVKAWTTANMLKLNENNTELMLVTFKITKQLNNLPISTPKICH